MKALVFGSTLILGGCNGCIQQDAKEVEEIRKMNIEQLEKGPEIVDYFGNVQMFSGSGATMTTGDFNGDGNLDLIVGSNYSSFAESDLRLYFFEGDGQGNFKLRQYEKK